MWGIWMINRPENVQVELDKWRAEDERLGYDDILQELRAELSKSSEGKALLDCADQNNIPILFYHDVEKMKKEGAAAFYHTKVGAVFLPAIFTTEMTVNKTTHTTKCLKHLLSGLAHELRHAWQDASGLIPHDMRGATYKDLTVLQRFMEADAFSTEVKVCRDLDDDNGYEMGISYGLWTDVCLDVTRSIAKAFEDGEDNNTSANDNNEAQQAGFRSFFNDRSRVKLKKTYDYNVLKGAVFLKTRSSLLPFENTSGEPLFVSQFPLRDIKKIENLQKFGVLASLTGNYLDDIERGLPLNDDYFVGNFSKGCKVMFALASAKQSIQKVKRKLASRSSHTFSA